MFRGQTTFNIFFPLFFIEWDCTPGPETGEHFTRWRRKREGKRWRRGSGVALRPPSAGSSAAQEPLMHVHLAGLLQLSGFQCWFVSNLPDRRFRPVQPLPRRRVPADILRQPSLRIPRDRQWAAVPGARGGHVVSGCAVVHHGSRHHAVRRPEPQDPGPADKHGKLQEAQPALW